jgi:predicted metal-dependent peptidase
MEALHDDPLATLEAIAARQAAAEIASKAIATARAKLILGRNAASVFFATLSLRLKPEVDWTCETMATDGRLLKFNPSFVIGLSADEFTGVLIHESMHCGLAHHCRRGDRDPVRWNVATDCSVNTLLLNAGFMLPKGRLMPGEGHYRDLPIGKSAEEYYSLLPDEPGGSPDPGGCGQVLDAGNSSAERADQEAEWRCATAQAEIAAKTRGALPDGIARSVDEVIRPAADWRAVLREFISSNARNDFSWSRPNRRFIAQGLYLPGLHSEELGSVVIAVDTSGSIGDEELAMFAAEVNGVLCAYDCEVTIVYHDSEVQHVVEHRSSDGDLKLEPVGGGGTSHVCVFDWLNREGRAPACVVCLTDMESEFPSPTDVDVPVLWAIVGEEKEAVPFGQVIILES